MMKLTYSADADAFYLRLEAEGVPVARTDAWSPDVQLDYDAAGRLIGIEVLDASTHFDPSSLAQLQAPGAKLSLAEAAKESGLSTETLRNQLNKGRIQGEKRGRDWVVARAELYTYLANRSAAGRPAASRKARKQKKETVAKRKKQATVKV